MLALIVILSILHISQSQHHHFYIPDCFGHSCTHNGGHETCVVNTHHLQQSYCGKTHNCGYSTCNGNTVHNSHCCCFDMACVEFVKNTQAQAMSTPVPVTVNNIKCSTCSDYANKVCSQPTTTCGANEVCQIRQVHGGPVTTKCENKNVCQSSKLAGDKDGTINTICCESNICSESAHNLSTTGSSKVLHCPNCIDAFQANCTGDSTCQNGDVCRIQVTHGRLEMGCTDATTCSSSTMDTFCCTNSSCTDYATKHIHFNSPSCPSCSNALDGNTCSNNILRCPHTSTGCLISYGKTGYSSKCADDLNICKKLSSSSSNNLTLCDLDPIPLQLLKDDCEFCCDALNSTCLNHALGLQHTATTIATSAPLTTMAATTSSAGTQGTQTTTTTTTTQSIINSTPVPTQTGCFDLETNEFNCTTYDILYGICSLQSPNALHIAYTRCPKLCGHCGQTEPSGQSTPIPTTRAPVTADPNNLPPCVDVGTNCNNTYMLQVCQDTSESIHNYAVANCAKTCNLCQEYADMLAQLSAATATTPVPTAPQGSSNRMCQQCGDMSSGRACTVAEAYTGAAKECPNSGDNYCMTTVTDDSSGRKIFKYCTEINSCQVNWLQHTSDLSYCKNYDPNNLPSTYTCHFCCVSDGCNSNIKPPSNTLFH